MMGDKDLTELAESLAEDLSDDGGDHDNMGDSSSDDGEGPSGAEKRDRNLKLILDIPLRVTVQLGRTKMLVSDLLNLGQGSVIELNKLAGEPMEVLVNDKLVAKGEAVVVNEKFGVRLTDIISPMERVETLGED
jgi:flagellar motor switch protein FliN/FliY